MNLKRCIITCSICSLVTLRFVFNHSTLSMALMYPSVNKRSSTYGTSTLGGGGSGDTIYCIDKNFQLKKIKSDAQEIMFIVSHNKMVLVWCVIIDPKGYNTLNAIWHHYFIVNYMNIELIKVKVHVMTFLPLWKANAWKPFHL